MPKKRKREQTDAGKNWFHMKAPNLTPELESEIKAIQLRRHINPKNFYRRNDFKEIPKFFQIGTFVSGANESSKIEKEKRRKTLVD
mmetsp:Transcript_5944/g.762  ORF Transcript_5944/g.762 Transcript_5944/m.762 type:complete len:86 (+) Transcript_5944:187-444(+)